MISLLSLIVVVATVSVLGAPLYLAFKNAAVGYEDEHGFHLGEQPAPVDSTLPYPSQMAAPGSVASTKKAIHVAAVTPELTVAGV